MRYNLKVGEYVFSGTVFAATTLQAAAALLKRYSLDCFVLFGKNGRYRSTTTSGLAVEMEVW